MDRADTMDRMLARIAHRLGLPIVSFFDETLSDRLRLADECMRLWDSLRTDDACHRALDALRAIAAEEA